MRGDTRSETTTTTDRTWHIVEGDGTVLPREFASLPEAEDALESGYGSRSAVAVPARWKGAELAVDAFVAHMHASHGLPVWERPEVGSLEYRNLGRRHARTDHGSHADVQSHGHDADGTPTQGLGGRYEDDACLPDEDLIAGVQYDEDGYEEECATSESRRTVRTLSPEYAERLAQIIPATRGLVYESEEEAECPHADHAEQETPAGEQWLVCQDCGAQRRAV